MVQPDYIVNALDPMPVWNYLQQFLLKEGGEIEWLSLRAGWTEAPAPAGGSWYHAHTLI